MRDGFTDPAAKALLEWVAIRAGAGIGFARTVAFARGQPGLAGRPAAAPPGRGGAALRAQAPGDGAGLLRHGEAVERPGQVRPGAGAARRGLRGGRRRYGARALARREFRADPGGPGAGRLPGRADPGRPPLPDGAGAPEGRLGERRPGGGLRGGASMPASFAPAGPWRTSRRGPPRPSPRCPRPCAATPPTSSPGRSITVGPTSPRRPPRSSPRRRATRTCWSTATSGGSSAGSSRAGSSTSATPGPPTRSRATRRRARRRSGSRPSSTPAGSPCASPAIRPPPRSTSRRWPPSRRGPISVARAAYWQGRAAEALGQTDAAKRFYEQAALQPIAYYGQVARARLGQTSLPLRAPADLEGSERSGLRRSALHPGAAPARRGRAQGAGPAALHRRGAGPFRPARDPGAGRPRHRDEGPPRPGGDRQARGAARPAPRRPRLPDDRDPGLRDLHGGPAGGAGHGVRHRPAGEPVRSAGVSRASAPGA